MDPLACSACQIVVEEINRDIAATPNGNKKDQVGFRIDPNKVQFVPRARTEHRLLEIFEQLCDKKLFTKPLAPLDSDETPTPEPEPEPVPTPAPVAPTPAPVPAPSGDTAPAAPAGTAENETAAATPAETVAKEGTTSTDASAAGTPPTTAPPAEPVVPAATESTPPVTGTLEEPQWSAIVPCCCQLQLFAVCCRFAESEPPKPKGPKRKRNKKLKAMCHQMVRSCLLVWIKVRLKI